MSKKEDTDMSKRKDTTIDHMLIAIIERRLSSICQEVGLRAQEGSYSICTAMLGDLGSALFDGKERLITHGEWLEIHVTGAHIALKGILDYIGRDNIHPGDFIVGNDPYIVRFGHLPDWSFVRPVFYEGEIMFYLYFRSHQHDSGGMQQACYYPRAFDIHAEGLLIPPMKIFDRGELNKDAYEMILHNVRDHAMVRMDNMTLNAAMMKAEERLIELCEEYGKDAIKAAMDESISLTEKVIRDEISKWPAGEYRAEAAADSDGTLPDPVWVNLKLTIKPDVGELIFDFTDNPRQVDFINCTLGQVWASIAIPLRWALPKGLPRNHALYNCVTVLTKEGTVFDPTYPATCGNQAPCLGAQIIELTQLALSQAIPTEIPAAWTRGSNPLYSAKYLNQIDPRTGAPRYYWFLTFHANGTMGGIWDYDGWDGLGTAAGGGGMLRASLENMEWAYPWRWLRSEWLMDSCGHGQFRGGMGSWVEEINEHPIEEYRLGSIVYMTGSAHGEKFPPFGLLGGTESRGLRSWILRNGKRIRLHCLDIVLGQPGDTVITQSGGGGGVGHPLDRDVEKVRWDALNEYISVKTAKKVYGVVIDPETFEVDEKATERLRKARKRSKSYRERFVPPEAKALRQPR